MGTYVQKLNGNYIAAYEVVPNSPLADQLAAIGAGAFQVVSLTSGANPVPNVPNPSTKIIYLTKDEGSSKTDPYTEWIYIAGSPSGTWEVIGETSLDLSGYKEVQDPVSDPSPAQGVSGLTFISQLSQNAQGVISLIKGTVQDASTSQKGVVQLQGTIGANETSDTTAATPKAVRDAINDLDVTAVTVGASKTLASISETDGKISATAVDIQISESQVTDLTTDLASKADKSTTVTNVAYDTTNKKITKTINGTTTDVVTLSQIESDLDLSGKEDVANKVSSWSSTTTNDHYPTEKLVKDSLDGKADKVSNATNGHFAGLDANGNLTDSGKSAADFATAAQGTLASTAVQSVKVYNDSTELNNSGNVVIPKALEGTASDPGKYGVVLIECIDI